MSMFSDDRNRGVSCDVSNCMYHDGKNICKADVINVGPDFANHCTDTACSTFKQKSGK